jgi:hypothetical protein
MFAERYDIMLSDNVEGSLGHGVHVVVVPCDLTRRGAGHEIEIPVGSELRTRESIVTDRLNANSALLRRFDRS